MTSHWSFSVSPSVAAFALAGWITCIWLAILQWKRRGGGGWMAAIEGIRLLAVSLVCLALFKPEIVQEIVQSERPKVVLGVSGSMATRDVLNHAGSVQTRAEWMAAEANPDRFRQLAAKGDLVVEDFGAPLLLIPRLRKEPIWMGRLTRPGQHRKPQGSTRPIRW